MAILTVYGDTADGRVNSTGGTWAIIGAGSGTLSVNTTETNNWIGESFGGSSSNQAFLSFDTSTLGSSGVVTAVTLTLTSDGTQSSKTANIEARGYNWTSALATSAWRAWGSTYSGLSLLASLAASSWTATDATANGLTSQSAFPAYINTTGTTHFMVGSGFMTSTAAPSADDWLGFYYADQTGTTRDPTLVVTYHTTGVPYVRSSASNALASAASITVTEPAGALVGDVLFAAVRAAGFNSVLQTPSTPTGWTLIRGPDNNQGFTYGTWLYYIIRGASAPSLTWTTSNATQLTADVLAIIDSPGVVETSSGNETSGSPPLDIQATTITASAKTLILWIGSASAGFSTGTSNYITVPTGFTKEVENAAAANFHPAVAIASKEWLTAGATGTQTGTPGDSNAGERMGQMVSLLGASTSRSYRVVQAVKRSYLY